MERLHQGQHGLDQWFITGCRRNLSGPRQHRGTGAVVGNLRRVHGVAERDGVALPRQQVPVCLRRVEHRRAGHRRGVRRPRHQRW